jgi:geranylgeranylglycerol-phosphate geranylgeranyltransferase
MLGSMVFITSPFNDIGDIAGDKEAGRRTIPIVIGKENTIRVAVTLSFAMIAISGFFFSVGIVSLTTLVSVSTVCSLVALNVLKVLRKPNDTEYMRKKHKLLYPLHIMLQSAIMIGVVLA